MVNLYGSERCGSHNLYVMRYGYFTIQSRDSSSSSTPPNVGRNWPTEFIKRHPGLTTGFSRKYDYKRAENEDPAKKIEWFKLVGKTIRENGIISDDIYKFDE